MRKDEVKLLMWVAVIASVGIFLLYFGALFDYPALKKIAIPLGTLILAGIIIFTFYKAITNK